MVKKSLLSEHARFSETVVIGGRGMLGTDLGEALMRDGNFGEVVCVDLPEIDITSDTSLARFFAGRRPSIIFNCAAFTDVDACESKRDMAFAVNAEGPGKLAARAAQAGALLVHISTDYVFDGRKRSPYVEEDLPAPTCLYGESKLQGERRVAESACEWLIVRTAWLYGRGGNNFVDKILRVGRARGELSGVTDQVGSPTWTRDLATALIVLVRSSARGLFHAVNEGACSRYEQVRFIVECAGLDASVRAVDSSSFPRPARVPAYSALSTEKLRRVTGHIMRPWQDALREYILTESPARG